MHFLGSLLPRFLKINSSFGSKKVVIQTWQLICHLIIGICELSPCSTGAAIYNLLSIMEIFRHLICLGWTIPMWIFFKKKKDCRQCTWHHFKNLLMGKERLHSRKIFLAILIVKQQHVAFCSYWSLENYFKKKLVRGEGEREDCLFVLLLQLSFASNFELPTTLFKKFLFWFWIYLHRYVLPETEVIGFR